MDFVWQLVLKILEITAAIAIVIIVIILALALIVLVFYYSFKWLAEKRGWLD